MMRFQFREDRYHDVMASAYLGDRVTHPDGSKLGDKIATFYATQRKCPYAAVIGHSWLLDGLVATQIDEPHARFLREDRAHLDRLASELFMEGSLQGIVRLVPEATIMFAKEPFCDVTGPLWNIQRHEIQFQHAFDLPITVSYRAIKIRRIAKENSLSCFNLRRDGSIERALRVSHAAYISGFDDTSDMEAAYQLGIPSVGTMSHAWVESFAPYGLLDLAVDFEQIAFEQWLDANSLGTVLLVDTYGYEQGIDNAVKAALSSDARKEAFRGIRIDSGDLIEAAKYCRRKLDEAGLTDVWIILTGDLDAAAIEKIVTTLPFKIQGFGVGTKLAAEGSVAGVIYKLCQIDGLPVMKMSSTPEKGTLPGKTQVWRCVDDDGFYIQDIISLDSEPLPKSAAFCDASPLLQDFWGRGVPLYQSHSPKILREIVKEQLELFKVPLEQYPVVLSPALIETTRQVMGRIRKNWERKQEARR